MLLHQRATVEAHIARGKTGPIPYLTNRGMNGFRITEAERDLYLADIEAEVE